MSKIDKNVAQERPKLTKDGPTSGPKRFLEASRFLDPQKVSAPDAFLMVFY